MNTMIPSTWHQDHTLNVLCYLIFKRFKCYLINIPYSLLRFGKNTHYLESANWENINKIIYLKIQRAGALPT